MVCLSRCGSEGVARLLWRARGLVFLLACLVLLCFDVCFVFAFFLFCFVFALFLFCFVFAFFLFCFVLFLFCFALLCFVLFCFCFFVRFFLCLFLLCLFACLFVCMAWSISLFVYIDRQNIGSTGDLGGGAVRILFQQARAVAVAEYASFGGCLLYTSPSPRD